MVIRYKSQCKVIVNSINAIDAGNDSLESASPEGIVKAAVEIGWY